MGRKLGGVQAIAVSVLDGVNTYESGRVVVTSGLSITIGFQNWVSLYDLVFQGASLTD